MLCWYSPVSVAMAGCSEGGTVSGRARALYESNPAHSNRAPTVAATLMPATSAHHNNYRLSLLFRSSLLALTLLLQAILFCYLLKF